MTHARPKNPVTQLVPPYSQVFHPLSVSFSFVFLNGWHFVIPPLVWIPDSVPLPRSGYKYFWLVENLPRGVLPYITYMGMCRPTGSWFWSSWFRMGYPFQRRFLEWGIIFRMHESSSFVSSHLKLFKVRLRLKIWFNALTSKLLHLRMEYKKLAHF